MPCDETLRAIGAVLFDNDGTLVDTHDLILSSMRHATQQVLGITIPDEVLMAKVGQPLVTQMWDFTNDETVHQQLVDTYREHNHAHHDQQVSLFEGVAKGLADLQAMGLALGVVTSKRAPLAWRGLRVCGVADYFACLIGADDCQTSKPHPGPVIAGVAELGLQPEQCLYVGDSPFDMAAGNGAGCITVAATWGMFTSADLAAEHPDYYCASFAEVVALCKKLQAFEV